MKKFVIISAAMMLLCSCGGSYLRYQDEASKNQPCNFSGYHVNNANWHFVDNLGQDILATGRCYKGMKHGNFDFFVNGTLVARTKFSRDREQSTRCIIENLRNADLQTCLTAYAQPQPQYNNPPVYNAPANYPQANYYYGQPNYMPASQPAPVKKSVWD